jgi:hypothetical protein
MGTIDELVEHIEEDVDRVSDLLEHIKIHIRTARNLYRSGTADDFSEIRFLQEPGSFKELAEISNHLLQIDAKIHELYHHIAQKETHYDPEADISVKKES